MNFVYPAFLWGAALVAIPIIIHLFNFQRPKKVFFTNIQFLRDVKAVSNSRNRLKNLLVLLARCLAIAALCMAFAQPFLPGKMAENAASSNYVSLYVDNSFSMQNERDGKKLLEAAVDYASQTLRAFPKNAQFAVLNNSFEADQNFFFEANKAADLLAKTDFSNTGRDFRSIYDRQLGTLEANTSEKRNHIFWVSDFQKHTSGNLANLALDSTNNFYLVPLEPNDVSNLLVDSVWLDNPFVKVNENNILNVKVSHFGLQGVTDKIVKLFIDGKQVSGGTVSLEPGASETIQLNFAVASPGQKPCHINLDDYPVTFDNDYFFTLSVAPEIRIVHIAGDNNNFVGNVYGNEPFFVVEKYSIAAVDYNKLNTANLVVLQGVREVDSGLLAALRSFLTRGGALLVFPPAQANVDSYTALLGLKVGNVADGSRLALNPPDNQNPFFGGVFEKMTPNMNVPEATPTWQWSGGSQLLSFRNDQPFLSTFGLLNSTVYLCAAPLGEDYSTFAKHALFVPVMYKIALSSRKSPERLAFSFGETAISLPLSEGEVYGRNDIFKLVHTDSTTTGLELIPPQRLAGNQLVIELPNANLVAGNYTLARRRDNQPVGLVAFNYDQGESRFDAYTPDELKAAFAGRKNVQVFDNTAADRFAAEFSAKNIAQPLWRQLLVAALVFLLIEVLILRFWRT
jgi:hypothetical protein